LEQQRFGALDDVQYQGLPFLLRRDRKSGSNPEEKSGYSVKRKFPPKHSYHLGPVGADAEVDLDGAGILVEGDRDLPRKSEKERSGRESELNRAIAPKSAVKGGSRWGRRDR
jgi:hypothetical protein